MKLASKIVFVLTLVLPALAFSENDVINNLKTKPATIYDLGIHKLHVAYDNWAKNILKDPLLTVVASENEEKGISFMIIGSYGFHKLKNKQSIKLKCDKIAQSFLSFVFSNFGDPQRKSIKGNNIYHAQWGAYFSQSSSTHEELEDVGRAVSKNSILTILTGNPLQSECKYLTGSDYVRVN